MKRVLLAFDGVHFPKPVFDFVIEMNKHQPVVATGFFLPAVDYAELLYSFGGVVAGPLYINKTLPADEKVVKRNITHFKKVCKENGIQCKVEAEFTKHIVAQIREETRFADLLVLNGRSFYENLGEETQDEYIENVLHKAECPVIIVPEEFVAPKSIVIAYDGSAQSVFAIKQFAYLFPEFRDTQVLLVFLERGKETVSDKKHLEELVGAYFTHFMIFKLKINPRKDLEKWLVNNGNTILVAGAYGRSLFSEMIRKSFVNDVVQEHKVPVFVAHK